MLVISIILIVISNALRCWYAANMKAPPLQKHVGFYLAGTKVFVLWVVLLIIGVILLIISSGFIIAILAIVAYLTVLDFVVSFLMGLFHLVPDPWEQ
jgi:hypothetical protein